MSKETADLVGLVEGERALYMCHGLYSSYLMVTTIKEVTTKYDDEIVVFTDQGDGYITIGDIYTKRRLLSMLEE